VLENTGSVGRTGLRAAWNHDGRVQQVDVPDLAPGQSVQLRYSSGGEGVGLVVTASAPNGPVRLASAYLQPGTHHVVLAP
jgi:hypothetical protein